jgi:uncharacterized repeat protein (TIGR03803 family)
VFKLNRTPDDDWQETVLQKFEFDQNGWQPYAALVIDGSGNLYGATAFGGDFECAAFGCGTVFQLSQQASGGWLETVLHTFNGADGAGPLGTLILDGAGNLYGTTSGFDAGGTIWPGTAFRLTPQSGGSWAETVLHSFGAPGDGDLPWAGLVLGSDGNLYGTTETGGAFGGASSGGTIFELAPQPGGGWAETVLHSFGAPGDGDMPTAGLVIGADGNLYGTTPGGGAFGNGTIFVLVPQPGGGWAETVLHSFGGQGDGIIPYTAGLVFDTGGNVYGTTTRGGNYGLGTVFELSLQ